MNLEGKQQIWKDYQKEIADDHYFYARSCIRQTFFPGSEWAYLDIMKNKLAKDVIDDPRHTTCTGIGYHSDIVPAETIMTVVARHFALMTEAGVRKHDTLLYHIFRYLHRDIGDMAPPPGSRRKNQRIPLESHQTGI